MRVSLLFSLALFACSALHAVAVPSIPVFPLVTLTHTTPAAHTQHTVTQSAPQQCCKLDFKCAWWANETMTMVQAAGTQTGAGVSSWQMFPEGQGNNMTSFWGSGQSFVADWTNQIVYMMNDDYYRDCSFTCAMDGSDTPCDSQLEGDSLCQYDMVNSAQFVAQETLNGVAVNHFHWTNPLVGIDMADRDIWTSVESNAPLRTFADFHPFGSWSANVTTDFVFNAGTPPPANFAFGNQQYCDPGTETQCQGVQAMVRRGIFASMMIGRFDKQK